MKLCQVLLLALLTSLHVFLLSCSLGTEKIRFSDPSGDAFGSNEFQYDIIFVDVTFDRGNRHLVVDVIFEDEVFPPIPAFGNNGLVGYIEIDADQNPDTGATLTTSPSAILDYYADLSGYPLSNMGVDYQVQLFEYDEAFETLTINELERDTLDPTIIITEQTGYVKVGYEDHTCTLRIPLAVLGDDDGSIDFGFIIGTFSEPTDIAYTYRYSPD
jgi:hypothetical protein